MLSTMKEMCIKLKLDKNMGITKVIVMEQGAGSTICNISLNDMKMDQLNKFAHLRSMIKKTAPMVKLIGESMQH